MSDHYTQEGEGQVGSIHTVEEARKAHHLATADPEKDGTMSGPEHEEKYDLERAPESRAIIEAQEAVTSGDFTALDGAEGAIETTEAPRASKPSTK